MVDLTSSIPPDVLNAMRNGNQLEAIKLLRKTKSIGLVEAKAILDAFLRASAAADAGAGATTRPHAASMHARHTYTSPRRAGEVVNHVSPGEVARGGGAGAWSVLFLIAVAVVAWLWLT